MFAFEADSALLKRLACSRNLHDPHGPSRSDCVRVLGEGRFAHLRRRPTLAICIQATSTIAQSAKGTTFRAAGDLDGARRLIDTGSRLTSPEPRDGLCVYPSPQGSRRGFIALSLPLIDSDYDAFAAAFEDFLDACGPVLA